MVGIRGLGCEACRTRKKKCDRAKPSCSRCTRLSIQCIGSGERRLQFKITTSTSPSLVTLTHTAPSRPPSNRTSIAASAFISTLVVSDPRYCVLCFGGFLEDLPRRLGSCDALDAAALAFASCVRWKIDTRNLGVRALRDYGTALREVRRGLEGDLEAICTGQMLGAVYLLAVCESLINGAHKQSIHITGLLHIINTPHTSGWKSEFDKQVLVASTTLIVSESITNPSIAISPLLTEQNPPFGPLPDPIAHLTCNMPETLTTANLVHFPRFFHQPRNHIDALKATYRKIRVETQFLIGLVSNMDFALSRVANPAFAPPVTGMRVYMLCEVTVPVLLSLTMLLNLILGAVEPGWDGDVDRGYLVGEVLRTAERVKGYTPLGTMYMPFCLCVALDVAEEEEERRELEAWMEYYCDGVGRWNEFRGWLEMFVEGGGVETGKMEGEDGLWGLNVSPERPCCVM